MFSTKCLESGDEFWLWFWNFFFKGFKLAMLSSPLVTDSIYYNHSFPVLIIQMFLSLNFLLFWRLVKWTQHGSDAYSIISSHTHILNRKWLTNLPMKEKTLGPNPGAWQPIFQGTFSLIGKLLSQLRFKCVGKNDWVGVRATFSSL